MQRSVFVLVVAGTLPLAMLANVATVRANQCTTVPCEGAGGQGARSEPQHHGVRDTISDRGGEDDIRANRYTIDFDGCEQVRGQAGKAMQPSDAGRASAGPCRRDRTKRRCPIPASRARRLRLTRRCALCMGGIIWLEAVSWAAKINHLYYTAGRLTQV
jgi:hypothetical protein